MIDVGSYLLTLFIPPFNPFVNQLVTYTIWSTLLGPASIHSSLLPYCQNHVLKTYIYQLPQVGVVMWRSFGQWEANEWCSLKGCGGGETLWPNHSCSLEWQCEAEETAQAASGWGGRQKGPGTLRVWPQDLCWESPRCGFLITWGKIRLLSYFMLLFLRLLFNL